MRNPHRGRVYRRCACRAANGKQLGTRCPQLVTSTKHGTWAFAVDMPSLSAKRTTMRRSGFTTKTDAQKALSTVLDYERTGVIVDDRQTVADYLTTWLADKALGLKPTTKALYHGYIAKDLNPALGTIRLIALHHQHITQFVHTQLAAGRGPVTLRR